VPTSPDALSLVFVVVLLLATYELARWLVALVRQRSLVCWSLGPLGVSAVYLRPPSLLARLLEAAVPATAVACVSYLTMHWTAPGLLLAAHGTLRRVGLLVIPVALAASLQGIQLFGDLRFPLWGEARVLALVERSRALGGRIHFTPAGREFLRERFGATPHEFLRAMHG
jgi:hypothetical protein